MKFLLACRAAVVTLFVLLSVIAVWRGVYRVHIVDDFGPIDVWFGLICLALSLCAVASEVLDERRHN